jgi:hypothetical protein
MAPRNIWDYLLAARPIHAGYMHLLLLIFASIWAIGRSRILRESRPEEWLLALAQRRLRYRCLGILKLFLRSSPLQWQSSTKRELLTLCSLVCAVLGVSAIVGLPYVYSFITDDNTRAAVRSTPADFAAYSVDLVSFFAPFNPLLDGLYEIIGSNWKSGGKIIGTPAFIGYGFMVILVLGVTQFFNRQELRLWVIALFAFLLLSLGPYLKVHGIGYESMSLPGYILYNLPLFDSARTPSRYLAPVMLLTSIVVCLVVRPYLLRLGHWGRSGVLVCMCLVVLFEYGLVPYPMVGRMSDYRIPEVYRVLAQTSEGRSGILLDLPLFIHSGSRSDGNGETRRFYYQTHHRQKLVGGVSSKLDESVFVYYQRLPAIRELQAMRPVKEEELAALIYALDINWIVLEKRYYNPEKLEAYRRIFDNADYMHKFYEDGGYLGVVVSQDSESLRRLSKSVWERPESLSGVIYPEYTRRLRPRKPQPMELIIPAKLWDYLELWLSKETVSAFSAITFRIDKGEEVLIQLTQAGSEAQARKFYLKSIISVKDPHPSPIRVTLYPVTRQAGVKDIAFPFSLLSLGQSSGYRLSPSKALIGDKEYSIHKRGITAFRISEEGRVLERAYYDTHASRRDTQNLAFWLERFTADEYLGLLVHDDGSYSLNEAVTGLLRSFGARDPINRKDWQHSYAFLGRKGLPEGKAWEAHSGTAPARINSPDHNIRLSDMRLTGNRLPLE